jgi:hypothetical protein
MNGILRVPRTRGVLSGLLLVLLGAWGALVPFVGPYFHYAYTPDSAWTYTEGRFWLEILPGAGAMLGGLVVLVSAYRPIAHVGAWLAALSGAWFVLGGLIGPTWSGMRMSPGTPVGGTGMRAFEQIGFFTGLGVVIVLLAAMVLGRFSVISVRDAKLAAGTVPSPRTEPEAPAPADGTRFTLPLPLPFRRKTADKSTVTDKNTGTEADTERVDSATARR